MSNVLIGIIGVILFIGLAIAGALILGSDFLTAGNESRAAASVTQMAQVAAAIQMFEMKTGTTFQAGTSLNTLMPRFLKSVPTNPTTGPIPATYTSEVVSSGGRTSLILMELGTRAQAVCEAIARQSGFDTVPVANTVATIPAGTSGCFRTSAVIGSTQTATYYAFNRTWGPATASSGTGGGNGMCYQAGNGTGGTQTNCPGGGGTVTPPLVQPPISEENCYYADGSFGPCP